MVNFVISIHEPDVVSPMSDDQFIEFENEAYAMAEEAAEDLTAEFRERFGPGWKATLDV